MNPTATTEDEIVEMEIMESFKAAQKREKKKRQIPLRVQEDLLKNSFPTIQEGQSMTELTVSEFEELRHSMQSCVSNSLSKQILLLQEQLSEYHDLLDQVETLKRQNQLLATTMVSECAKKDNEILLLKEELRELKDSKEVFRPTSPSYECAACTPQSHFGGRDESITIGGRQGHEMTHLRVDEHCVLSQGPSNQFGDVFASITGDSTCNFEQPVRADWTKRISCSSTNSLASISSAFHDSFLQQHHGAASANEENPWNVHVPCDISSNFFDDIQKEESCAEKRPYCAQSGNSEMHFFRCSKKQKL